MLPKNIAFVDVETTGLSAPRDRIIEIGIARFVDGKVIREFTSLVNPECHVSPDIEQMTGLTTRELLKAPTFYQIRNEVKELLEDSLFVAHNVRFDYSFLKNEFRRQEMSFSPKQFCTVKLSRQLFPRERHHNLDSIIKRFGIDCPQRHRALSDAKVLVEFYRQVTRQFPEEVIVGAIDRVMKKPSLPTNMKISDFDSLENTPGVYMFFGEHDAPLYIGKSKNIRTRVMTHFSSDHASVTEMKISQQTHRIKTYQTAGELGALLLESQLIKTMQPIYNRKLRLAQKLVAITKAQQNGYDSVELEQITTFTPESLGSILGIFRSRKKAKDFLLFVSKEQELCHKLLSLEKTKSSCFMYRLGKCKGACIGRENSVFHNARFLQAFSATRIKPWPYGGPIAIGEVNADNQKLELFFIDKWCLIGSISPDSEMAVTPGKLVELFKIVQAENHDVAFDLDMYKIIRGYIANSKYQRAIYPLVLKSEFHSPSVYVV